MVRAFNHNHLVFIFVLLISLGKSFTVARQVKELVTVLVPTETEFAAEAESKFSLKKENVGGVTNAAEFEYSAKTGGRKMSMQTTKKTKTKTDRKASVSSSAEIFHSMGNGKGDHRIGEEQNWKDSFKAFSADYRSPKSHPPKNN